MIDWNTLHYDPIYANHGETATITGSDFEIDVTVIHAVDDVDVGGFGVTAPNEKPIVCVRASQLASLDIIDPRSMLRGAFITFANNDDEFSIDAVDPRPGPTGRSTGEWALVLRDNAI